MDNQKKKKEFTEKFEPKKFELTDQDKAKLVETYKSRSFEELCILIAKKDHEISETKRRGEYNNKRDTHNLRETNKERTEKINELTTKLNRYESAFNKNNPK